MKQKEREILNSLGTLFVNFFLNQNQKSSFFGQNVGLQSRSFYLYQMIELFLNVTGELLNVEGVLKEKWLEL